MKERLGVLDGLRGIAILQVLWYHTWLVGQLPAPLPWLQFIPATGSFGVQLFFFLSGFVIIYPFIRATAAGQPEPTWTHFAWRRFIKIVPSYALSIAVAYAIGFAAYERATTHTTVLQELVTHALFIHTWWPATAGAINAPLWTLGIEVEFYALFPLLWWFLRRRPFLGCAALIASSFVFRILLRYGIGNGLMLNLPGFADFFGFGMLTAFLFVRYGHRLREGRARRLMPIVALAGGALMITTFVRRYEGYGSLVVSGVPVIQTAGVLGLSYALLAFGALCSARPWANVLSNPFLRFFAIVSYNLYLFNWMILHAVQWRLTAAPGPSYGTGGSHLEVTVAGVGLSIAIAAAITYGFERPLLRLPDPKRGKAAEASNLA